MPIIYTTNETHINQKKKDKKKKERKKEDIHHRYYTHIFKLFRICFSLFHDSIILHYSRNFNFHNLYLLRTCKCRAWTVFASAYNLIVHLVPERPNYRKETLMYKKLGIKYQSQTLSSIHINSSLHPWLLLLNEIGRYKNLFFKSSYWRILDIAAEILVKSTLIPTKRTANCKKIYN